MQLRTSVNDHYNGAIVYLNNSFNRLPSAYATVTSHTLATDISAIAYGACANNNCSPGPAYISVSTGFSIEK